MTKGSVTASRNNQLRPSIAQAALLDCLAGDGEASTEMPFNVNTHQGRIPKKTLCIGINS